MIEQLSTELEEEGFFFALGEEISALVLAADPNGHGYLVTLLRNWSRPYPYMRNIS